jgi:hypothetical protein
MKKEYRIIYLNADGEHAYKVNSAVLKMHEALNKILEYNKNDSQLKIISVSIIEHKGKTQWEGYL